MATSPSTTAIEEFSDKELLDRIRPLLQRDKIRLWEHPYTDANTGTENIPEVRTLNFLSLSFHTYVFIQDLIESVCAELGSTTDEIRLALSYLRRHALEKLAAKKRVDLITLKIRLSGTSNNKVSAQQHSSR